MFSVLKGDLGCKDEKSTSNISITSIKAVNLKLKWSKKTVKMTVANDGTQEHAVHRKLGHDEHFTPSESLFQR